MAANIGGQRAAVSMSPRHTIALAVSLHRARRSLSMGRKGEAGSMRNFWLAAVMAAASVGTAALARTESNPEWVTRPTDEQTRAVWPAEALARGVEGRALLQCRVNVSGLAEDCQVVLETPIDHGFGAAALQLAPTFRFKPATKNEEPSPAAVRVPIWFSIPLDTKPDWLRRPGAQQLYAVFPKRAIEEDIDGRAVIDCGITITGMLEACEVEDESPAGYGFGEAALLLAPSFLLKPGMRGGKPAPSSVRIPIVFKAGGATTRTGSRTKQAPTARPKTMILDPIWEEAPSFADLKAAWPKGAVAETAHVSMRCVLKPDGRLDECRHITEFPVMKGFGKAAEKLGDKFRMRVPPGQEASVKEAELNLPIRFIDPASSQPPSVSRPRWITQLDPDKVAAVYPAKAAESGVRSGVGVAECVVARDGRLTDCRPGTAKPAGLGFAEAAVTVASVMRMNPWSDGGGPVDGARIKLPITFNLSEGETAPKP